MCYCKLKSYLGTSLQNNLSFRKQEDVFQFLGPKNQVIWGWGWGCGVLM